MFQVKKAKRQRRPLKVNLEALSGGGKTYTALRLAFAMRRAGIGKRIVVADSENESASLYDGVVEDGEKWEYEVCPIPPEKQNPLGYAECYEYLVEQGFDIIIMDSLTHAWKGALARVDELAAKSKHNDKFGSGWRIVTPEQEHMMRTITDPRAHFIGTMRVKSEYERVTGNNGKEQMKKVGMKTDQRDGTEYEFDAVARMDPEDHSIHIEKVRGCTAMDGKYAKLPGPDFWKPLFDWWLSADDYVPPPKKLLPGEAEILAAKTIDELNGAWKKTLWNNDGEKNHLIDVAAKRKAEILASAEGEQSRPPSASGAASVTSVDPNSVRSTPATFNSAPTAGQTSTTGANATSKSSGSRNTAQGISRDQLSGLVDETADRTGIDGLILLVGMLRDCCTTEGASIDGMTDAERAAGAEWLRKQGAREVQHA